MSLGCGLDRSSAVVTSLMAPLRRRHPWSPATSRPPPPPLPPSPSSAQPATLGGTGHALCRRRRGVDADVARAGGGRRPAGGACTARAARARGGPRSPAPRPQSGVWATEAAFSEAAGTVPGEATSLASPRRMAARPALRRWRTHSDSAPPDAPRAGPSFPTSQFREESNTCLCSPSPPPCRWRPSSQTTLSSTATFAPAPPMRSSWWVSARFLGV
jgi:hypothetical protein